MTPVFCCGFECGVNNAHWISTGAPYSTVVVRSGARAFRVNPTATTVTATSVSIVSATRWIGRFYLRFATLPSASCGIFGTSTTDGTAGGPKVHFNASDSKIYAKVGTTVGATGVSVTTGAWYRIDFDFNISTGGNDTCDVQIDGTAVGQATAAGESAATATLALGAFSSTTADFYIDDVVLSNTAADYPIGAGYVNHFVPTSDGTHNIAGTGDFQRGNTGTDILNATTNAYLLIDDVPLPSGAVDEADCQRAVAPPNATDYVEGVFGPGPGISTPTVAPRTVEAILAHHQVATQTGMMKVDLNDNGTVDSILNITPATAGVTTYRYACFGE